MSKVLDYDNLSDEDKAWLRARGWGSRIPGEGQAGQPDGVVLDPNASSEDVLAQMANTGTATVANGTPINGTAGDKFPSQGEEGEVRYTREDYAAWKVSDLNDEIADRNEDRDDADQIEPTGRKKADLVDALVADDEARATASA